MPPACPGDTYVRRYTHEPYTHLPRFARRGFAAAGETGEKEVRPVCSEKRKYPPDKPGAFASCQSECRHLEETVGH